MCAKVVGAWTAGCNDFVHMYMSTVLFLTYNQFDGKGICTAMHTCEKKESGKKDFKGNVAYISWCDFSALLALAKPEKAMIGCEHCQAVEQFIAQNHEALHAHAVEGIYSNVCQKLPTALGTMVSETSFAFILFWCMTQEARLSLWVGVVSLK